MTTPTAFIVVAIVVLAAVALLVFRVRGKGAGKRLSPLAGLAFACVVAGILLGADRAIGYGLMGIGLLLALADIWKRSRG